MALSHTFYDTALDACGGSIAKLDELPISQALRDIASCIQEEGNRKGVVELHSEWKELGAAVSVAKLFAALGLCELPPGWIRTGARKPGTHCKEDPRAHRDDDDITLANWFRMTLNFDTFASTDHNGWTILHHAADAMTFSTLAARVMDALLFSPVLDDVMRDIIDAKTHGSQPPGWTALHMLCDGSDKAREKPILVQCLLEHGANIEVLTGAPKITTPLQKAVGTGVVDTVKVLIRMNANPNVMFYVYDNWGNRRQDKAPKDLYQLAEDNSTEMKEYVQELIDAGTITSVFFFVLLVRLLAEQ